MSLFKVMRGNSADLGQQELHDGYAWYTLDEGGFYIDGSSSSGIVTRKKINDADNITVDSQSFASSNLKTILEGLDSADLSVSYDSETETLTISNSTSSSNSESEDDSEQEPET